MESGPNNFQDSTDLQEHSGQVSTVLQIVKKSNGAIVSYDDSDSDQDHNKQQLRKKYGNMKVLLSGRHPITIGPDYWCFLPTFLAFSIVSYFLIELVFATTSNLFFRLVTTIICIGEPLSYLLVALSNPGIVTEPPNNIPAEDVKQCNKCILVVPKHARHCKDCDVCIEHYDHHCPWTSKCIGGGNLIRFYIFLGWTPVYLIYITVAFVGCMSSNLIKIQHVPPQKLF